MRLIERRQPGRHRSFTDSSWSAARDPLPSFETQDCRSQWLKVWIQRIDLGRLPGNFTLRWRGREVYVPLASSVLLSVLAMLVGVVV